MKHYKMKIVKNYIVIFGFRIKYSTKYQVLENDNIVGTFNYESMALDTVNKLNLCEMSIR